ncbi:MAG: hypothetical protein NW701_16525 [Nitrospira sp.]
MLKEFKFFHGVVFADLIHATGSKLTIRSYSSTSNSSYVINENFGLYIKYSSKRMSPWRYSFKREHQDEIAKMRQDFGQVYVIFVCNDDGYVALNFSQLKTILNDQHDDVEWVSVSRNRREMYLVNGSDGKLPFKVGQNNFSKKLLTAEERGKGELDAQIETDSSVSCSNGVFHCLEEHTAY